MALITKQKTDEFEDININISRSSKGTIMRAKRQTGVGKDICKTHSYQRAHFQSRQRTLTSQKNKIKFNKKMGKKFEYVLQRKDNEMSTKHKKRLSTSLAIRRKCKLNQ